MKMSVQLLDDVDGAVRRCLDFCLDYVENEEQLQLSDDDASTTFDSSAIVDTNFNWETYLESVGCLGTSPFAFEHVEQSLSKCELREGQIVAVVADNVCKQTYWPAEVRAVCKNEAHLQLFGAEIFETMQIFANDRIKCLQEARSQLNLSSEDFPNVDTSKSKEDAEAFMISKPFAHPSSFIESVCSIPTFERIRVRQFVEVQSVNDPREFWPCRILRNVGGRLQLAYFNGDEDSTTYTVPTFWLFYRSERIFPAGFVRSCLNASEYGWKYAVPKGIELIRDVAYILQTCSENSVCCDLIEIRLPMKHSFEKNMKLEVLHPITRAHFLPANIVEILNDYYVQVELDCGSFSGKKENLKMICHNGTPGIFPVNWCAERRLRLSTGDNFEWPSSKGNGGRMTVEGHFAKQVSSELFYRDHKLEAVNPMNSNQICCATIVRVVKPLLWVHLDSSPHLKLPFAVHLSSTELFPTGWCKAFDYPLCTANFERFDEISENLDNINDVLLFKYLDIERNALYPSYSYLPPHLQSSNFGCEWSPAIYFNPCCYVGPYISRERLATMPMSFGPGPLYLVLKKMMGCLMSAAYKPRDLYVELQHDPNQPYNPDREPCEIKVKYKQTKGWRGVVEICKEQKHVKYFCLHLCRLLEACPSLVALYSVNRNCNLSQRCPHSCEKVFAHKPSSVLKILSSAKVKKLKKRVDSRNRQFASINGVGVEEPVHKRRRLLKEHTNIAEHRHRPVTRGAVPFKKFNAEKRPVRTVQQRTSLVNGTVVLPESIKNGSKESLVDDVLRDVILEFQLNDGGSKTNVEEDFNVPSKIPPVCSNPFKWTPAELYQWLVNTEICKVTAAKLRDENVDGQAFLLFTLPDAQNLLNLKLGPALKFCEIVKELKTLFLVKYAESSDDDTLSDELSNAA